VSSAALQNLVYALIQVFHNFGAAGVLGFASYGVLRRAGNGLTRRSVFVGLAIAWGIQGASGASFGIASLSFYGKLPDIHGIAVTAVSIKMVCVAIGFFAAFVGYRKSGDLRERTQYLLLILSFVLGATALSAAAFLRWFS
jgi:hypothetical protein